VTHDMKLVHWPLMGGLLHLVQQGEDWAGQLKSRLGVTGGHRKRHHSTDHTTTYCQSRYLTLNIMVTLKCGLEVIQGH